MNSFIFQYSNVHSSLSMHSFLLHLPGLDFRFPGRCNQFYDISYRVFAFSAIS